jgi:hypothetical protein
MKFYDSEANNSPFVQVAGANCGHLSPTSLKIKRLQIATNCLSERKNEKQGFFTLRQTSSGLNYRNGIATV